MSESWRWSSAAEMGVPSSVRRAASCMARIELRPSAAKGTCGVMRSGGTLHSSAIPARRRSASGEASAACEAPAPSAAIWLSQATTSSSLNAALTARRSILALEVRGKPESTTKCAGTMYAGSSFCVPARSSRATASASASVRSTLPGPPGTTTNATMRGSSPAAPGSAMVSASFTAADTLLTAALISSSSMRTPWILTWSSLRPRYSISPSASMRTRSPVRYTRPNSGCATNRSAVLSASPM